MSDLSSRLAAAGLRPDRLPRHVAVIMDGNGRWARRQDQERVRGHQAGVSVVHNITVEAVELGLPWLTLYAFSSENWARPRPEVDFLMQLLLATVEAELPTYHAHQVRLRVLGRTHRLPEQVRRRLAEVETETAQHRAMVQALAISYGGREEIVDACRHLAAAAAAGRLDPTAIDEAAVQAHLYAPEAPDVDLLIRTAGEQRVSNLLLWQSHYAEFVSTSTLWPDFTVADFHAALRAYQARERRFGRVLQA